MSAVLFASVVVVCAPCVFPAFIFFIRHRGRAPDGQRFPLSLYVVALLVCAFVAFWAGTGIGVEFACRRPADNLCGLAGFFVAGPLSALFAVSVAAWLMTLFPRQMKRIVPVALILIATIGGYQYRYFFFRNLMAQPLNGPLIYRLQSADVDDLQRYAPMMEAKLRNISILKDVCLDPELRNDQALISADPKKPVVGVLPTRALIFRIVPPSKLDDAIRAINDARARLAIPATVSTSWGKAESDCH